MATCASIPSNPVLLFSSSREFGDRSQSHFSTSSSACVSTICRLRAAVTEFASTASVSVSNKAGTSSRYSRDLVSSFWSKGSYTELQAERELPAFRGWQFPSVPLVEARLFGPAIFEAAKLRVLLLIDQASEKGQLQLPRAYTLTHSDVTSKITLAVSREVNKAQLMGWYSKLQRDEVLAEWRRTQGDMSLHVHCHISGGNWLHDVIAKLRFYIFQKELPVVLEAFMHGDRELFEKHPELQTAPVWVYFHSNMKEYNKIECWGPLADATKGTSQSAKEAIHHAMEEIERRLPTQICPIPCECCSRHVDVIPLPKSFDSLLQEENLEMGGEQDKLL